MQRTASSSGMNAGICQGDSVRDPSVSRSPGTGVRARAARMAAAVGAQTTQSSRGTASQTMKSVMKPMTLVANHKAGRPSACRYAQMPLMADRGIGEIWPDYGRHPVWTIPAGLATSTP
jgi:hypothetical protein